MITSFMHFGISVASLARSLDFYCRGLGFDRIAELKRPADYIKMVTSVSETSVHAAVICGYGITIELLEYSNRKDRPERAQPPHFPGMAHICLEVDSINNTMEKLTSLGAIFKENPTIIPSGLGEGNTVIYGWDPDGIPFELVQIKDKG